MISIDTKIQRCFSVECKEEESALKFISLTNFVYNICQVIGPLVRKLSIQKNHYHVYNKDVIFKMKKNCNLLKIYFVMIF